MLPNKKEYKKLSESVSPNSRLSRDMLFAFIFGGAICTLGQFFINLYMSFGIAEKQASALCSITLVFITALLTGFKVFDNIATIAGAGTLVPITGFANSVVSPAMEFKSEGFIYGLAAKMFVIVGPILVFGTIGSISVGLIYYVVGLFL